MELSIPLMFGDIITESVDLKNQKKVEKVVELCFDFLLKVKHSRESYCTFGNITPPDLLNIIDDSYTQHSECYNCNLMFGHGFENEIWVIPDMNISFKGESEKDFFVDELIKRLDVIQPLFPRKKPQEVKGENDIVIKRRGYGSTKRYDIVDNSENQMSEARYIHSCIVVATHILRSLQDMGDGVLAAKLSASLIRTICSLIFDQLRIFTFMFLGLRHSGSFFTRANTETVIKSVLQTTTAVFHCMSSSNEINEWIVPTIESFSYVISCLAMLTRDSSETRQTSSESSTTGRSPSSSQVSRHQLSQQLISTSFIPVLPITIRSVMKSIPITNGELVGTLCELTESYKPKSNSTGTKLGTQLKDKIKNYLVDITIASTQLLHSEIFDRQLKSPDGHAFGAFKDPRIVPISAYGNENQDLQRATIDATHLLTVVLFSQYNDIQVKLGDWITLWCFKDQPKAPTPRQQMSVAFHKMLFRRFFTVGDAQLFPVLSLVRYFIESDIFSRLLVLGQPTATTDECTIPEYMSLFLSNQTEPFGQVILFQLLKAFGEEFDQMKSQARDTEEGRRVMTLKAKVLNILPPLIAHMPQDLTIPFPANRMLTVLRQLAAVAPLIAHSDNALGALLPSLKKAFAPRVPRELASHCVVFLWLLLASYPEPCAVVDSGLAGLVMSMIRNTVTPSELIKVLDTCWRHGSAQLKSFVIDTVGDERVNLMDKEVNIRDISGLIKVVLIEADDALLYEKSAVHPSLVSLFIKTMLEPAIYDEPQQSDLLRNDSVVNKVLKLLNDETTLNIEQLFVSSPHMIPPFVDRLVSRIIKLGPSVRVCDTLFLSVIEYVIVSLSFPSVTLKCVANELKILTNAGNNTILAEFSQVFSKCTTKTDIAFALNQYNQMYSQVINHTLGTLSQTISELNTQTKLNLALFLSFSPAFSRSQDVQQLLSWLSDYIKSQTNIDTDYVSMIYTTLSISQTYRPIPPVVLLSQAPNPGVAIKRLISVSLLLSCQTDTSSYGAQLGSLFIKTAADAMVALLSISRGLILDLLYFGVEGALRQQPFLSSFVTIRKHEASVPVGYGILRFIRDTFIQILGSFEAMGRQKSPGEMIEDVLEYGNGEDEIIGKEISISLHSEVICDTLKVYLATLVDVLKLPRQGSVPQALMIQRDPILVYKTIQDINHILVHIQPPREIAWRNEVCDTVLSITSWCLVVVTFAPEHGELMVGADQFTVSMLPTFTPLTTMTNNGGKVVEFKIDNLFIRRLAIGRSKTHHTKVETLQAIQKTVELCCDYNSATRDSFFELATHLRNLFPPGLLRDILESISGYA